MTKLYTTDIFIDKARAIHGNRYDYSIVEYKSSREKVSIICPDHGVFQQEPAGHLRGKGCAKCNYRFTRTTDQFITEAKSIHGDRYDYSHVVYINSQTPVTIVCPMHGEFTQRANDHIHKKTGCPRCSGNIPISFSLFKERAKIAHGSRYSYSDFTNMSSTVTVHCNKHGLFQQNPYSHLNGHGCPKCAGIAKLDNETFIKGARAVHGDKYDYSLVDYFNSKTPIKIICKDHGIFEQTPNNHVSSGQGCKLCYHEDSLGGYSDKFFERHPEMKTVMGIFYIVEFTSGDESFLKIGITTRSLSKRYGKQHVGYKMMPIIEAPMSIYDAYLLEQTLRAKYKRYRYKPQRVGFTGKTECFLMEAKDELRRETLAIF